MKRSSFSKSVAVIIAIAIFAGAIGRLTATPNLPADSIDSPATARATVSPRGALVEWLAEFDTRILGFNVVRITGAQRVKLNPGLIAGPTMVSAARERTCAWFDPAGTLDSNYEVESIDLRGETLQRMVATSVVAASLPAYRQTPLLANLGEGKAAQVSKSQWRDETKDANSSEVVAGDASASLTQQWSIANQPALKIGIRSDGWYRITQPQLAAAGFDITRDARNLQLFVEGNEIALSVSRDTGVLSSTDFVEFWGQGLDSPTTDTRVYWLINGQQAGKRISLSGGLRPDSGPPAGGGSPDPSPALSPSPKQFSFGSWPIVDASATDANGAKKTESVAVVKAISTATLSDTEKIETIATKETPPSVSAQPLAKDSAPQPAPSTQIATQARASLSPMTARDVKPAKSRPRRKRSRNHRRKPRPRLHNHAIDAGSTAPAFSYSIEYSAHNIYFAEALNGDHANFYGPVVPGNAAIVTLTTPNIERTSTAPAQLTVSLQGASLGAHQINVLVNDTLAGLITFSDQSATAQTFSFPSAWLIDGANVIKLVPSSANDTSLVDSLRLTYAHSFRAENDSLQFSVKATQTARIDGFSSSDIRVVDVSDPSAVQIIRPVIDSVGNGFAATVPGGDRGKARRLVALPAARISQPAWLTINQASTLNSNANAADLVIIAYKDFIPALAPLVAQRQAQGYAVKVADIDDVYDEFSFGEHTPQAIRDFMLLAKNSWARAPAYLLLVGDASYDPRNRLGSGSFDFVPTKLVDTGTAGTATALEAASDDALTDFDGDGIADIAVGRLPVRTVAEANVVVSKIVNFSPANTGNNALLVADTQGSYYFNFEAANDQVATTLPAGMTIQKVYRRLQPSDSSTATAIKSSLNAGQSLTVYSGHGNATAWAASIFTAADASALNNGNRLSFVVVMDCLNGFFDDPTVVSLAESLLSAPNGGAVASFASSGLTVPDGQHQMGFRMFQLLYNGSPITIGDASRQAKTATTDMDVRRTWVLFGDPTLKIR